MKDLITQGGPRSLYRCFLNILLILVVIPRADVNDDAVVLIMLILTLVLILQKMLWCRSCFCYSSRWSQRARSPSSPCDSECLHHICRLWICYEVMIVNSTWWSIIIYFFYILKEIWSTVWSVLCIYSMFNKLFPQKLYYVTHIQGQRQVVWNILKISNKSDFADPTQVCQVNLQFISTILIITMW